MKLHYLSNWCAQIIWTLKWVWINVSWQPRHINAIRKENIGTLMRYENNIFFYMNFWLISITLHVFYLTALKGQLVAWRWLAMGFHLHWSLPDYQIKLDKEFICTHLMKKVCLSVCTLTALALACTGQCCLSVCPYIGGNLPKVRSRYFPYGILPGPYFHSIPKGEMVFANLIFPMLNPHRQLCKYGPHLWLT